MARRLQNRLALAQFKTKHGWEDLTLDVIEPKFEKEIRRHRLHEGDILSDSSSSASDNLPYPSAAHRGGLMSSPLKAPFFHHNSHTDAFGSSSGPSTGGHRKRTYLASFDYDVLSSSPSKRFRHSPTAHRSFTAGGGHQLAQSSPIKPRRQQHFTTSTGPDVSFSSSMARQMGMVSEALSSAVPSPTHNYNAPLSDEDDDLLPAHSFHRPSIGGGSTHHHSMSMSMRRPSPPRTPPPMRSRNKKPNNKDKTTTTLSNNNNQPHKTGEEGADLLLYLAASPSPATKVDHNPPPPSTVRNTSNRTTAMEPPSTPPQRNRNLNGANDGNNNKLALPSSMMTTPGGGNPFPATPGLNFDFSDFVHMTPSPAQKPWRTPLQSNSNGAAGGRTPLSVARRRLTFDDMP